MSRDPIATEAHDDDGLPHTLEHLVFMGSEKYPYKACLHCQYVGCIFRRSTDSLSLSLSHLLQGVLDLVANRCLAQGTNAWTDVDHTCYTVTTAGSEGFLNLLPVYLDHVLYPTLTVMKPLISSKFLQTYTSHRNFFQASFGIFTIEFEDFRLILVFNSYEKVPLLHTNDSRQILGKIFCLDDGLMCKEPGNWYV